MVPYNSNLVIARQVRTMKPNQISIDSETRSKLLRLCERLDFQKIVDWVNAYAERSESITELDDEAFTVLAGYLVQNTSFQLATEIENLLPSIKDAQLKGFLARLRDELRHWSLRELRDAQAYGIVGMWGHKRRQLYAYLGIDTKKSSATINVSAEVKETKPEPSEDEPEKSPLN